MQNVPKDMRERRVLSCSSIRGDPETRQKRILRNKKETSERKKKKPQKPGRKETSEKAEKKHKHRKGTLLRNQTKEKHQ